MSTGLLSLLAISGTRWNACRMCCNAEGHGVPPFIVKSLSRLNYKNYHLILTVSPPVMYP